MKNLSRASTFKLPLYEFSVLLIFGKLVDEKAGTREGLKGIFRIKLGPLERYPVLS